MTMPAVKTLNDRKRGNRSAYGLLIVCVSIVIQMIESETVCRSGEVCTDRKMGNPSAYGPLIVCVSLVIQMILKE